MSDAAKKLQKPRQSEKNVVKYAKKIKKSQHLSDYQAAVSSLFAEQDLVD